MGLKLGLSYREVAYVKQLRRKRRVRAHSDHEIPGQWCDVRYSTGLDIRYESTIWADTGAELIHDTLVVDDSSVEGHTFSVFDTLVAHYWQNDYSVSGPLCDIAKFHVRDEKTSRRTDPKFLLGTGLDKLRTIFGQRVPVWRSPRELNSTVWCNVAALYNVRKSLRTIHTTFDLLRASVNSAPTLWDHGGGIGGKAGAQLIPDIALLKLNKPKPSPKKAVKNRSCND